MSSPTSQAVTPTDDPMAELCAKCGFTYYNHESNTGVPYPCWTPSGRYSTDKRKNNPFPVPAASPLPEEPRKCPSCGTKLIPASQAFSEIRERITAEEPPQKSIACPNCGFPSTVPTTVIRGAMDCPNCHYRFHPRPFTPDEPQDLKETLAEFEGALLHETVAVEDIDVARVRVLAARAALVAIYERQSEALEMFRDEQARDKAQVASLSSQLANERFEHRVTADSCEDLIAQRNSAESSLERLKAEQRETKLTDEEIRAILDDADNLGWQELTSDGQRAAYDRAIFKLRAKLRSRSQSDTGDTNG